MSRQTKREEQIARDEEDLKRLGYAQQLFREMGGFSNFAISFSIISILTGAVLLFGYGLKFAGPAVNTIGWPIVSLFTLAVAASMAELASAYPTAGGLYFWAFRLGGRTWAWWTAWLNMIGQVTITAGINIAAATYLIGAWVRIFGLPEDMAVPLFGSIKSWYFQIAVMTLLMIPQVLINIYGIKLVARLNDVSVYWHIIGGALIIGLLVVLGKHHNPASFLLETGAAVNPLDAASAEIDGKMQPALVFGDAKLPSPLFALFPALTEVYRAAPLGLVFVLGLLQAQWTYTGYDASAHVAEETVMARLNSAWGVFLSVAVSAVVGYLMLLTLTWCIPDGDIAKTANDAYPVLFIAYENLPTAFGHLVALIIGGAMWLCGSSSITSMARMWYAFARDEGMPASGLIKQIHPELRTPVWSILITSLLAILICLYAAAFYVVTSISTITLYLAYGIPVLLNLRNKIRDTGEHTSKLNAPWNLGRWSTPVNIITLLWIAVITVIFILPPNELVLWTILGLVLILGLYWGASENKRFRGPSPTAEPAGQDA